jgi:hypothetical protein
MKGQVWDNANNSATAYQNYTTVDLSVVEHLLPNTGESEGQVHWRPYEGDDFHHYEVWTSPSEDFDQLDNNATKLEEITDQDTNWWNHTDIQDGDQRYYKIYTYVDVLGESVKEEVSHEVEMNYAGVDGRISVVP